MKHFRLKEKLKAGSSNWSRAATTALITTLGKALVEGAARMMR